MVEYLQVNVMMVEYRGYGDSHDVPKLNEEGLKLDAEAALEFARNHSLLRTTPLFVYGQSLVRTRTCNYRILKDITMFDVDAISPHSFSVTLAFSLFHSTLGWRCCIPFGSLCTTTEHPSCRTSDRKYISFHKSNGRPPYAVSIFNQAVGVTHTMGLL
jgi:hypothetical protein